MHNKKILFISLVLICSAAILFYFWQMRKEFNTVFQQKRSADALVTLQQSQLKQSESLQDSFRKSAETLKSELSELRQRNLDLEESLKRSSGQGKLLSAKLSRAQIERRRIRQLREMIDEAGARNAQLAKDLEEARKKFSLIEPLKEKFSDIESALAGLELKKGKEELLKMQLYDISRQLNSVNNYMFQLLAADSSALQGSPVIASVAAGNKDQSGAPGAAADKNQVNKLKNELEESHKAQEILRLQCRDFEDQLNQARKELDSRVEKIFALQEKVMAIENNLFEARADSKEKEKDAAVLREKYVAVELEKSSLQIALDQTRQELGQLQAKFLSLLGRIGGIFKSGDDARALPQGNGPAQNSAKIGVELIPQDNDR